MSPKTIFVLTEEREDRDSQLIAAAFTTEAINRAIKSRLDERIDEMRGDVEMTPKKEKDLRKEFNYLLEVEEVDIFE